MSVGIGEIRKSGSAKDYKDDDNERDPLLLVSREGVAISFFGPASRINDCNECHQGNQSAHYEDDRQVSNVKPDTRGKNSECTDQSCSSLLGFYTINVMLKLEFTEISQIIRMPVVANAILV